MRRNKNKQEQQESPIIELVDEKVKDILSIQVQFQILINISYRLLNKK